MKKRGIGIGTVLYGIGNTHQANPASAFLEWHIDDGTVTVQTGCADIGQGSDSVLAQIVAETLGVDYKDVRIISADTDHTPDSGNTSASRQTWISGNACKKAAEMARHSLFKAASIMLDVPKDELYIKDKTIFSIKNEKKVTTLKKVLAKCKEEGLALIGCGSYNPNTDRKDLYSMHQKENGSFEYDSLEGNAYGAFAYGVQCAEVEVDTETGEVTLLKMIAAQDVGKAINAREVEGQIESSVVQGLGMALFEDLNVQNCEIKNTNYSSYLIPTAMDMPELYSLFTEEAEPSGPFGAKGAGEAPIVPTVTTILNAVYDAIGVRFTEVPLTQELVLQKIKEREKNKIRK